MMQILSVVKRAGSCRGGNAVQAVLLVLVLVLGIGNTALADSFVSAGSLNAARTNHAATLLADGRVLLTGGRNDSSSALNSAEIFDPTTGQCTQLPSAMQSSRAYHTATRLNDGRVLIAGGSVDVGSTMLATAEIFDPASGTFTPTGSMSYARGRHTATLLSNGTVLITGGGFSSSSARSDAEIYDPSQGKFLTPVVSMHAARLGHTATLLSDGRVLVAGGTNSSAEIYAPATGIFTVTGSMSTARRFHTATLLSNNTVLITGGNDLTTGTNVLSSAEIYTPSSGTFASAGFSLFLPRENHQASLLANGNVIISGGQYFDLNGQVTPQTTELYTAVGVHTTAADMNFARFDHTATPLADGVTVLMAGGINVVDYIRSTLSSTELYNSATIAAQPVAYAFGNTILNTPQSHDFTVTNNWTDPQTLGITFSGTDASLFHSSASGCSPVPAGGSCTVTVTFLPTSLGNKQATMKIAGTTDWTSVPLTGTGYVISTYQLTVNAAGNGSGTVTSTPAGINNCVPTPTNSTCFATFAAGQITLAANPPGSPASSSNASYFSGWAGPTGCSGNSCIFTLSGATTVTASFNLYPATIGKTAYYATLQDAYNGAASGNQIWLAGSYSTSQAADFANNIPIVVKGGYDDGFGSVTGYSTIGTLTIGTGSAVVDHLTIH